MTDAVARSTAAATLAVLGTLVFITVPNGRPIHEAANPPPATSSLESCADKSPPAIEVVNDDLDEGLSDETTTDASGRSRTDEQRTDNRGRREFHSEADVDTLEQGDGDCQDREGAEHACDATNNPCETPLRDVAEYGDRLGTEDGVAVYRWCCEKDYGAPSAPADGSLSEWADSWYIAHGWSDYGSVIKTLRVGDVVIVNGIPHTVVGSAVFDMYEYVDVVYDTLGWDSCIFQTCIDDSRVRFVACTKPNSCDGVVELP